MWTQNSTKIQLKRQKSEPYQYAKELVIFHVHTVNQSGMYSMLDAECSSVIFISESPCNILKEQLEANSNNGILYVAGPTVWRGFHSISWKFHPFAVDSVYRTDEKVQASKRQMVFYQYRRKDRDWTRGHWNGRVSRSNATLWILHLTTAETTAAPSHPNSLNLNKTEAEAKSGVHVEKEEHLPLKEAKPPKTFFDKMIWLLTEKLDDQDNYVTVVDGKHTIRALNCTQIQPKWQKSELYSRASFLCNFSTYIHIPWCCDYFLRYLYLTGSVASYTSLEMNALL